MSQLLKGLEVLEEYVTGFVAPFGFYSCAMKPRLLVSLGKSRNDQMECPSAHT